jgi:hypothetical protein
MSASLQSSLDRSGSARAIFSWTVASVLLDGADRRLDHAFNLVGLPIAAAFVMTQWNPMMDTPSRLSPQSGYGWQVHEIREATVAIILLTIVFATLLAALHLLRLASTASSEGSAA